MGILDTLKHYAGVGGTIVGGPLLGLGLDNTVGDGSMTKWLGETSGQPTSNIPDADRSNFNTPGGDARGARLLGQARNNSSRAAPQSRDNGEFRGMQQNAMARLSNQMNGLDNTTQNQFRQATDSNIAQQRSLAAGASPGNAAMAQRMMGQNIGKINQGYGSQSALLGMQERNAAANSLAGLSTGARGQDLQNSQFNASAQLQNRGINDQAVNNANSLELGNAQLQQQGNIGYEQNQTQRRGQDLQVTPGPTNAERVLNGAGQGAGIVAPFLADGGVVTEPTHAVIGEAGPEAVIPLHQLPTIMQRIAEHVSGMYHHKNGASLEEQDAEKKKNQKKFISAPGFLRPDQIKGYVPQVRADQEKGYVAPQATQRTPDAAPQYAGYYPNFGPEMARY